MALFSMMTDQSLTSISTLTPEGLDHLFPYVCFAYGAMITFVLKHPTLIRIAVQRLPAEHLDRLRAHGWIAQLCLWVGAIWILQNIWSA